MNRRTVKSSFLIVVASLLIVGGALFLGPHFINPFGMGDVDRNVLLGIRLPRVLVALIMGAGLGASGAVLQGFLRNPLADPYILGLSGGAALMASGGILFGSRLFGPFSIPLYAFVGSLLTGLLVGFMAYWRRGFWPERLLLAGVGLGFLFTALLMLMMSLSTNEGLRRAIHWIFGDLSISDWPLIPYGGAIVAGGGLIGLWRARALNALMLGDEIAHSLGFSPFRERLLLFISVGLMTSASVSLGGTVGFVGLLIPHIVRFLTGPDARSLIPLSAFSGAAMLCLADLIGRTVLSPMEVPAGIVTAILGAPYFLYLLRRQDVLGG